MNWTVDQQKIIHSGNCNLLVSAAAGSGKTAVLVERIIRMISDTQNPIDIDQLLVVTFTKAAAAQMRDKIAGAIEKMLEQEPFNEHYLKQMNYINQANILTIDSFCYQVVKEHFYVLGIDPGIRIGDTGELGLLREEVLERVIEQFYANNPHFVEFADAFSADKNDEKIEDYILKIYDVCSSYPRPYEWTRQAREALLVHTDESFHKLSVVKQYFEELHSSAEGIRIRILSALEQVRSVDGPLYMEKALQSDIELVDSIMAAQSYVQFAELASCKFANIGRGKKGTYDEDMAEGIKKVRERYKKEIKALLSAFEIPLDELLSQMQQQAPMLLSLLDAVDVFRQQFMQEKLAKNILEFSDVEHFALQVLCGGYDEAGSPQPSAIGREMSENFVEILIDEYQDSNYLQEAILSCVSTVPQGRNNIFMVGDVKQSIYRFRMARPDLFMEKYHSYPTEEGGMCQKLLLKNNFRSRANILESINYMFYQIMGRDLGGIEYTEDEALVPGKEYQEVEDDSVELLIGESRNFEFLSALDEAGTSEKSEDLDEELEDIGKLELEAAMVAKRMEELLGKNGQPPLQIADDKTGKLRNATYGDIVILFRAPAVFQQVFREILMAKGIPVRVQNEKGYFDTVELRLLLSLLKVLDNPYNDVELAAVLRSYFGECSNGDLTLLILLKRELEKKEKTKFALYKVIQKLAEFADGKEADFLLPDLEEYADYIRLELADKCRNVCSLMERLQKLQDYAGISQILSFIYRQEGYYYYVQSMPEGGMRIRNLDLFYEEARKCGTNGFCSVFDFLRYVDKIQKKSITLGGDPGMESGEDVVRIMSIHKSKGLEFPIVFLAGTGRNFNLMDTKIPLIIHADYFVGAKYRDTAKRCGNDSFVRKAMAALMVTESIAEELRIFYVGLTRAKDKLIMTGVTTDVPALVKKYENIAKRKEDRLSFANIHTARNYLDLIVMSLMRNDVFASAMGNVRKRMDKKGENIISAEYERTVAITKPEISLTVNVYDFESILVRHLQSDLECRMDRDRLFKKWEEAGAKWKEELCRNLDWEYSHMDITRQKAKLSVTEIKRIYETDYEPSDVIKRDVAAIENYAPPIPHFLAGDIPMNAAEKGTWMHKTMELFDFVNARTKEQILDCLDAMRKEGRIPEETREFITAEKVYALVASPLGKRICKAAEDGHFYKEKQFVTGVPANKILNGKDDDPVIVQGIIDAYFREGDKLILIDYKTDHVRPGQEEFLVKRYHTQLRYYKETLEQLTGLPVAESYIYSFTLDKAIEVR
ncbi:MAG: helicase-exonuclease AddAB subunit AddA [Clostridium sp.]|nr:helicase-exonuclease AddAB subunit AddA [Clostridium sp.]